MSNTAKAFDHGKALIPFITCGDPSMEITEELILAIAARGADMIELGIPFSDPMAEGPVIQGANERALNGGATPDAAFDMIARIRTSVSTPIVLVAYANLVFSRGIEHFALKCAQVGVDGLMIPDLPLEERDEFESVCTRQGIDLISVVAPTSRDRASSIADYASGFVCCAASPATYGTSPESLRAAQEMTQLVKQERSIPCAADFGVATPQQARLMSACSDGVIVGSAIVELCAEYGRGCVSRAAELIGGMKLAMG